MTGFWQDLRLALRTVWKQPGFTLTAAITLALGIGANTAIFSVINALILNPPNFAEAERVVALWRTAKDQRTKGPASYLDLQEWQSQSHSFEAIAGYKGNDFTLLDKQAERVSGMRVTANLLSALKVTPLLGREFQADEEKRGAKGVVIVSARFWQTRLAGDTNVIGRELTLDGKPFTVVGVLPEDFEFPLAKNSTDILTTVAGEGGNLDERGAMVLLPFGRLKPGVTVAQAQSEFTNISANLEQQYPQNWHNTTVYLVPVAEEVVGS